MSQVTRSRKPAKPAANFPLYPSASGQWVRKIAGKTAYFGSWRDDRNGVRALEKFLAAHSDPRQIPTIADVEKSGEWISKRSAISEWAELYNELLESWRRSCPYVKGNKLTETIKKVHVDAGQKPMRTVFFLRAQLTKAVGYKDGDTRFRKWAKQHSKQYWLDFWKKLKEFTDRKGRRWVITGEALAILGVDWSTLNRWKTKGCPFLDGAIPATRQRDVGQLPLEYFLAQQMDDIRDKIDALLPAPRKKKTINGKITKAQAIERAGVSSRFVETFPGYDEHKEEMLVLGTGGNRHYETFIPKALVKELKLAKAASRQRSLQNLRPRRRSTPAADSEAMQSAESRGRPNGAAEAGLSSLAPHPVEITRYAPTAEFSPLQIKQLEQLFRQIHAKPNERHVNNVAKETQAREDTQIAVAWSSGNYPQWADLGAVIGKTAEEVEQALDRHRKRLKARRKK